MRIVKLLSVFAIVISVLGCAHEGVTLAGSDPVLIETFGPGDRVRITTVDEETYWDQIIEITDDAVVFEDYSVLRDDILGISHVEDVGRGSVGLPEPSDGVGDAAEIAVITLIILGLVLGGAGFGPGG